MIGQELQWDIQAGISGYSGYNELAMAIIVQAIKDYVGVLRQMMRKMEANKKCKLILQRRSLEGFFRSSWFEALCDLNGEVLITQCHKYAVWLEKEWIRKKNRERIHG